VGDEEVAVFAGEDVVGYGSDGVSVAEGKAERQHQGGFPGADGPVVGGMVSGVWLGSSCCSR